MPWSGVVGSQIFTRVMGVAAYDGATCWGQTDAAGRGIRSDDHDYHDQDMAQGINACIHRGGGNTVVGNIPMGGFRFTNMGPGVAATDSVRMDQLESGVLSVRGDMLYRGAVSNQRLAKGTNGSFLAMGANDPVWVGLGTAAYGQIGTSGHTVPVLDGNNTWSGYQSIVVSQGSPLTLRRAELQNSASGEITVFVDGHLFPVGSISIRASKTSFPPAPGATFYNESSDGRWKKNRRQIDNSGDIIDRLNPLYYDGGFGFVAQEVDKVVPGFVVRGDDGEGPFETGKSKPWQMQYGRMEPIVVAELKALRARVAALEAHDAS